MPLERASAAFALTFLLGCATDAVEQSGVSESELNAVTRMTTRSSDKQLLADANAVYSIAGRAIDRFPSSATEEHRSIMSPVEWCRQLYEDATHVYVFDGDSFIPRHSGIWRFPKAGGSAEKLLELETDPWSGTGVIAIGDDEIFFYARFWNNGAPAVEGIFAMPKSALAGPVTSQNALSLPGLRKVASATSGPRNNTTAGAVLNGRLYYLDGFSLLSVPTTGGTVSPVHTTRTDYGTSHNSLRELTVVGTKLYFLDDFRKTKVYRFESTTSDLAVVHTFVDGDFRHLAGDAAGLYVGGHVASPPTSIGNRFEVYRLNGSSAVKVASYESTSRNYYVRDMAVDAHHVYLAAESDGILRFAR